VLSYDSTKQAGAARYRDVLGALHARADSNTRRARLAGRPDPIQTRPVTGQAVEVAPCRGVDGDIQELIGGVLILAFIGV